MAVCELVLMARGADFAVVMAVPTVVRPMFCLDQDLIAVIVKGLMADIANTVIGRGAFGIIAFVRFPRKGNIRC